MKIIKNIIISSLLLFFVLFVTIGCKEDKIVFPDQIEGEENGNTTARGPVKQNNLSIITENDEIIKFDLNSVDKEKVKALVFSINPMGEKVATEVTDFTQLYSITNLSLEQNTEIEVKAIGLDGKESKAFSYFVKPLPYPAKVIAKTTSVRTEGFSGILNISNSTALNAKIYYKLDGASEYTMNDLPKGSISNEFVFPKQTIGQHRIEFFVQDELGNNSNATILFFEIFEPTILTFNTKDLKVNWTPWASNGYDAGFSAERAIDGVVADKGGYEFVTGSNANPTSYKISFTKQRYTSDPNYRSEATKNPSSAHNLLVVKSVTLISGSVDWGVNPSIARVYGYLEDNSTVLLGTFSHPSQVTLNNPFTIDLSKNVLPLKALRFDVVNSLSNPTSIGMNINEINLTGYYY